MEKKIVSLVAVAITGCATPNNNYKGNDNKDKSFHKFLESKGFEKNEIKSIEKILKDNNIQINDTKSNNEDNFIKILNDLELIDKKGDKIKDVNEVINKINKTSKIEQLKNTVNSLKSKKELNNNEKTELEEVEDIQKNIDKIKKDNGNGGIYESKNKLNNKKGEKKEDKKEGEKKEEKKDEKKEDKKEGKKKEDKKEDKKDVLKEDIELAKKGFDIAFSYITWGCSDTREESYGWTSEQKEKKEYFEKLKHAKWNDEKIKLFFGNVFENVDKWRKGDPDVKYEKGTVVYLNQQITSAYAALELLKKAEQKEASEEEKRDAQKYKKDYEFYNKWEENLIEAYNSDAGKYFKYLLWTTHSGKYNESTKKIKEIVGYKE